MKNNKRVRKNKLQTEDKVRQKRWPQIKRETKGKQNSREKLIRREKKDGEVWQVAQKHI